MDGKHNPPNSCRSVEPPVGGLFDKEKARHDGQGERALSEVESAKVGA